MCFEDLLVGCNDCYRVAVGASDKQWADASDDEVGAHLEKELQRANEADSVLEVLKIEDAADSRAAFLHATKQFHPNRFARRPRHIRRLANDVYIVIKEAYDKAQLMSADGDRKRASTSEATALTPVLPAAEAQVTSHVDDSEARKDLAARRRERARSNLKNSSSQLDTISRDPVKGAQIRTATQPQIEAPTDVEVEEARFQAALEKLDSGNFSDASVAFKKLAVARPSDKRFRMHMHYCQGKYHQAAGRHGEARSEYQRALGIDTSFTLAHKAMATLPQDPEKKKAGLLSRFFRK